MTSSVLVGYFITVSSTALVDSPASLLSMPASVVTTFTISCGIVEARSLSRNVRHPLRKCNVRYQAFFIKMLLNDELVNRISWEMFFATYISVKRETNIKLEVSLIEI